MAQTIKDQHIAERFTGDLDEVSEKVSEKIKSGEADGAQIGIVPDPGDVVKINGLDWKVVRADSAAPRITLELL